MIRKLISETTALGTFANAASFLLSSRILIFRIVEATSSLGDFFRPINFLYKNMVG